MDLIHLVQAADQWWANEMLNSKEERDFLEQQSGQFASKEGLCSM